VSALSALESKIPPDNIVPDATQTAHAALRREVAAFAHPSLRRGLWQVANSFGLLLLSLAAMYDSLGHSYVLTLGLSLLAAGFVVRVFIIQHDCGHGAFFRSRSANIVLGCVCSLVTLTPYAIWRRQHAGHHGNWNNLDRRWSGVDLYSTCLTATEYCALSPGQRWRHRLIQHPLVALLLLPPLVFLVLFRVPFDTPSNWKMERRWVHVTNVALIAVYAGLGFALGFREVLLVQLPVSVIASVFGVWLFSLQHRFEHALWARQDAWVQVDAALYGSSYLHLPRVLQWFTGNIGFHHIHHLNPRVPNYRLQTCFDAVPGVRTVPRLTLRDGLRAFRYGLWDESRGQMTRFRDVHVPVPRSAPSARVASDRT
jgi:acyl-lipid omega-6 desaturase (Delta-12 desaturase)